MSGIIQIVIGGLLQGGVFAIVALGFSLVFRVTNVINLSQGAFCVLGAMGMYYFQVVFGWPILPAALAAVLASTAFGLLVGALTFVPAVSRLPPSSMLVLTAGLLTFLVGITLVVWGNQPYALPPFSGEAPFVFRRNQNPNSGHLARRGVGGHDRRPGVVAPRHHAGAGVARLRRKSGCRTADGH